MSSPPAGRAERIAALTIAVRQVIAATVLRFEKIAQQVGVNATDMQCLNILDFEGPVTAGRLAELTGLTTGAMTTAIDRLEKAGYVRRVRDPQDRRRVIVQEVPREGFEVFAAIDQTWQELCSRYSDQELAVIFTFIDAMQQMNHEANASYPKSHAPKQTED